MVSFLREQRGPGFQHLWVPVGEKLQLNLHTGMPSFPPASPEAPAQYGVAFYLSHEGSSRAVLEAWYMIFSRVTKEASEECKKITAQGHQYQDSP